MKQGIWILLVACTLQDVLPLIRPGAQWVLGGNAYSGLEWLDVQQSKPTANEVTAAIVVCNQQEGLRTQAKIDLNVKSKSEKERIEAIITYLGLDK